MFTHSLSAFGIIDTPGHLKLGAKIMEDSPTSLSEDTCASLDAIVVHETFEYFLVEITTPRARALIDVRAGFLDRLLALHDEPPHDVTSEMDSFDRASFVEACASSHEFVTRPSTNTWHPESSSRELSTDEFARASRYGERAQLLRDQRAKQKSK